MRAKAKKIFSLFIFIFTLFASCTSEKGEIPEPIMASPCDTVTVTYSAHIKTIVQNNCINPGCHGSGYASGDLRDYTGLKAKVDNNSLSNRVLVVKDMPSFGLSTSDLLKIKCWIEAGAPNN